MNFLQRIIKKINQLKQDKKDHFYLGLLIGFPSVMIFGLWGGIASLVFFAFIEVYQFVSKKGNFEVLDFVASAIPVIMFLLILIFR